MAIGGCEASKAERRRRLEVTESATLAMRYLGEEIADYLSRGEVKEASRLLERKKEFLQSFKLTDALVIDRQGLIRFGEGAIGTEAPSYVLEAIPGNGQTSLSPDGRSYLISSIPEVGYFAARLGFDSDKERQLLWTLRAVEFFIMLAGMLLLLAWCIRLRSAIALRDVLGKVARGDYTARLPTDGEKDGIAEQFNGFVTALSHMRSLETAVNERTSHLLAINARLERLAVTDDLTGIANRRRFDEVLRKEAMRCLRHDRPMAILMIDLDHFNEVNDAIGHPSGGHLAGDELLRRVAAVLSADLRETDLIARYGGDEFAVILPETRRQEAAQVGERMRAAVEARINAERKWPITVTISIGVASFPEDGSNETDVLRAADKAMYEAKGTGNNRLVVSEKVLEHGDTT